jgi:integrase
MAKINLTQSVIERMQPGTSLQDSKVPSLYCRKNRDGTVTFNGFKWSRAESRPVRANIGRWPSWSITAARERAAKFAVEIDRPEMIAARTGLTLGQAVKAHTAGLAAKGRRHPNWLEYLVLRFAEDWATRRLPTLTREAIQERHDYVAKKFGPVTAGRWVKAMRTLYRSNELPNPAKKVSFIESRPRRRYLSQAEEARLLSAIEQADHTIRDFIKLSLLTGARRANVQAMHTDQVDLDAGEWRIPEDQFKTGEPMLVHLVPQAMAVIRARVAQFGKGWVFPADSISGHMEDRWYEWDRIRKAAGVPDVTIHDLRRTFAVRLVEEDAPLPVISAALGHKNPKTTLGVYALAPNAAVKRWVTRVRGASVVAKGVGGSNGPGADAVPQRTGEGALCVGAAEQ